jgi:chromosome segregation protein
VPDAATGLESQSALPRLLDKLRCGDAGLLALLSDWLNGCYAASSLQDALQKQEQLERGACWVAAQGHVVTRYSVSLYAADSEQAGLLARAHEIDNLEREVRAQSLLTEQAREAVQRAESAYAQESQALGELRRAAMQTQAQQHEAQVQWLRQSQAAEQARARSTQLEQDLAEGQEQAQELARRSAEGQQRFEVMDAELGNRQEAQALCEDAVRSADAELQAAREQQRQLERLVQECDFEQRNLQARLQEVQRAQATAQQQIQQALDEIARAQSELVQLSDVAAQGGLQSALALKHERELALAQRRSVYDDLTARLRGCDEQRQRLERELDPLRHRITEWQLKEQAAQLGLEQYQQQLQEAQADLAALVQALQDPGLKPEALPAEVERLQRAIAGLGAVNLAALDELGTARERKQFLDAQSADLRDAMATLEAAIRQIDAETRTLLGETFNVVNGYFGRMFPELFGGGQARLVMTGEEVLDSGVQVFAQPPGKKNQTIQLLSGGEKALTAIALVFAIFQLNPAPFCLLDEVDAPLDEANTERYAKLVMGMSKVTQFLFISHNKIAMEMAQQLIGVTMQEQGVSRIVAVDMESALALAQTA